MPTIRSIGPGSLSRGERFVSLDTVFAEVSCFYKRRGLGKVPTVRQIA